ncbi:fatty acyl-CoA reductase wat-like [Uranotaenia lowii]|uniref:fatty acyl-CoA reductase wat-like n=1 Tax=Uranotaenia lowii TaxID=190385 RepID=UPI00247839C2|nr:fatty acyl-CoA reductase wat-like [Uranotaenia lowii]
MDDIEIIEEIPQPDDPTPAVDINANEAAKYDSPVREFYQGSTVFLTGGLGFLGKLYIEKLIQCGVAEILLLSRGKKGKTPIERLTAILEKEPVFTSYHKDPEFYLQKIKIIDGDVSKHQLGISNDDLSYIHSNANVFIHAAADVRFDESLKEAVETNVRGTHEILKIAEHTKNIKSFVYVSTAFSQCNRERIEEKFYPPVVDPFLLIKMVEQKELDVNFEIVGKKLIEPWPNTYAFTKSLAENLVYQYSDRIPVGMIRPSIVTSTHADPIPGWTDNVYGFNGVVIGVATGALRIFHIYDNYRAEIIPVDVVVNATLALGYRASQNPQEAQIVNCTNTDNPISWGLVRHEQLKWKTKIPFLGALWVPTYNTTKFYAKSEFLKIFYHVLPAIFFDLALRIKGEKPKVLGLYRKVHKFSDVIRFFTTNQWDFADENFKKIRESLTEDDRKLFPCETKTLEWTNFLAQHIMGLRMYIMKEKWDNLEKAKSKYWKQQLVHYVLVAVLYSLIGYSLLKLVDAYARRFIEV